MVLKTQLVTSLLWVRSVGTASPGPAQGCQQGLLYGLRPTRGKGSRSLSCLADFTRSVALEPLVSPTADQGFLQLLEASDPMQPLPSQKSVLLSLKWTRRRSLASVFQQGRELLLVL